MFSPDAMSRMAGAEYALRNAGGTCLGTARRADPEEAIAEGTCEMELKLPSLSSLYFL